MLVDRVLSLSAPVMNVSLSGGLAFVCLDYVVQPVQIVFSQYRTIACAGPCTGPLFEWVLSRLFLLGSWVRVLAMWKG